MKRHIDAVRYLKNDKRIARYLSAAAASGDARTLTDALSKVIAARGLTQIAEKAGIARRDAYDAIYGDVPLFAPTMKIAYALGFEMRLAPAVKSLMIPADAEIVRSFQATGVGWEGRLNEALRAYLSEHSL